MVRASVVVVVSTGDIDAVSVVPTSGTAASVEVTMLGDVVSGEAIVVVGRGHAGNSVVSRSAVVGVSFSELDPTSKGVTVVKSASEDTGIAVVEGAVASVVDSCVSCFGLRLADIMTEFQSWVVAVVTSTVGLNVVYSLMDVAGPSVSGTNSTGPAVGRVVGAVVGAEVGSVVG